MTVIKLSAIEMLDEKNHRLKAIAPFFYKKYTTIIENFQGNILPNSKKVKTVKHIYENQKQRVQHQENNNKNQRDQRKCLNVQNFPFFSLQILKVVLKYIK